MDVVVTGDHVVDDTDFGSRKRKRHITSKEHKSNVRAALGRVCLKLVVVMGVTWIADLISFAVGGPQEIWYLTDIINSIHGVFIFIVIGCQPQVLSAVKRFWCLRKHKQNGAAGTTHHHSTSSQGPPSMGDTLTNTNSVITNGTYQNSTLGDELFKTKTLLYSFNLV
ncbi:unnamed protein product [Diabrotica balteata]|uniref:G-protein coupled receptors family 2 profile 2 domain-containing protein n=1 Tax=Diabrotica balteata TaxID=107213 RepID=A0A9N9T8S8_DIABA|nr:unnamed protein product [Diabrotica balteata]